MCKGINLNEKHYSNNCVYKPYILLKGKRKPYDYLIKPSKHNLELIYSNMLGPILVKDYNGSWYILTFIYNRSKLIKVYLIKTKEEVYNCFIYFKRHYKQSNLKWVIKRLCDDNTREYILEKLINYLFKNSINLKLIKVYSSQINRPIKCLS
jgi:hypothetical protein